ncbi:MAG: hypothetical protein QM731_05300 [Chitinophagaceae bacterium]
MNTSSKIKIWTIILQALIVVGFGHGIIPFIGIEIYWFPYFTKEHFSFAPDAPFEGHLPVIGLITLLGQASLVTSMVHQKKLVKNITQVTGLILLWISIAYFIYNSERSNNIYFVFITSLPFTVLTLLTFAQKPLKRLYNAIIETIA